ncbi:MAG: TlpA family protein disulfide reductase [Bacteroidota bacterium]|nr:TlpA family protein disulfide reductase [Bacteroidota bacterium]
MNKFFAAFILSLLVSAAALAQKSTLNISLSNSSAKECDIWLYNLTARFEQGVKGYLELPFDRDMHVSHTFSFTKPQFVRLSCSSDTSDSKHFYYNIFITPGDNISLKADFSREKYGITVTGRGSENNQPPIASFADMEQRKFYSDTLPYRIIAAIKKQQPVDKNTLDDYVKKYKPSAEFIKASKYNLEYFPYKAYYTFKEENKYQIRQAYTRNFTAWQKIQDSLSSGVLLNNADALVSFNYLELIGNFLLREKERLWQVRFQEPETFFKQWYNADVTEGPKLYNDDPENLLQEKIINKYFTGKCAEYLYAVLLNGAIGVNDPKNIVAIFNRYKQRYPADSWFNGAIDTIKKREQRTLDGKMIFVADNGTNLNTLEDVLALTKGKTVLLDMWGTWCGPCRQEMANEGPLIKAYFKGKGLDYLYVANRDLQNEGGWKKLIAYFDLKGTHILANASLTKDIMAKVKGTGYPTYVIIKKDGTYELSKAGYPMNREILIKQLEAALAQ